MIDVQGQPWGKSWQDPILINKPSVVVHICGHSDVGGGKAEGMLFEVGPGQKHETLPKKITEIKKG
jgi:hypothetical protein